MELIIFIIVVGVIFSNLNKQRKASSNRDEPREVAAPGTARPRTPTVRPMETRPQTPSPFAPRQQHSMPQSAPTAQVKPVEADAKAKPFAPSVQQAAKSDDAPRDVRRHEIPHPQKLRRTGERGTSKFTYLQHGIFTPVVFGGADAACAIL